MRSDLSGRETPIPVRIEEVATNQEQNVLSTTRKKPIERQDYRDEQQIFNRHKAHRLSTSPETSVCPNFRAMRSDISICLSSYGDKRPAAKHLGATRRRKGVVRFAIHTSPITIASLRTNLNPRTKHGTCGAATPAIRAIRGASRHVNRLWSTFCATEHVGAATQNT